MTLTIPIPGLLTTIGKNPLTRSELLSKFMSSLPPPSSIHPYVIIHLSISFKSYSNLWHSWPPVQLHRWPCSSGTPSPVNISLILVSMTLEAPLSLDPPIFTCFSGSHPRPSFLPSLYAFLGNYIQSQCCNYLHHETMEDHKTGTDFLPSC